MPGGSDDAAAATAGAAATHDALTLELNCDSVDWCPLEGLQHLLAVGVYQLDEASGQRRGQLRTYACGDGTKDEGAPIAGKLAPVGKLDVPGVLDVRWLPGAQRPLAAAALADGSVRAFFAGAPARSEQPSPDSEGSGAIAEEARLDGPPACGLALCADPVAAHGRGSGARLAVSYSSGRVAVLEVAPSSLVELCGWQGHELEAWVAAADPWDPCSVYSGGDDCVFAQWDLRVPLGGGDGPPRAANRSARAHGAGVCAIAPSPHQQHVLLTGSYDERARLWDKRLLARPVEELHAGGGVWRLRWHPTDPSLLLAALMHAGFGLLRVNVNANAAGAGGSEAAAAGGTLSLVERYDHHRSLAYGAGWCSRVGGGGTGTVATCSFYDRLLHVWSPATRAAVP